MTGVQTCALPISSPALLLADLTPALGRRNHTTSPSASAPFVKGAAASTASRPALMTLRNTPLWGRTAGVLEVICPTREVKYFRCGDWTGQFAKAVLICPSGSVATSSRTEQIAPAHANRQNRTTGISEITRNRTCCGHAKSVANDPTRTSQSQPYQSKPSSHCLLRSSRSVARSIPPSAPKS